MTGRVGASAAGGPTGVVVMAYGTPASLDDVEAYYTHIRRGRPPAPEQLAELAGRYEALGGTSPLLSITTAQAGVLEAALGEGFVVALGQKHAAPFIEDGVAAVLDAGAEAVVGVVLAPHYSTASVGEYASRLAAAVDAAGEDGRSVAAATVEHWHDLPAHRSFLVDSVREGLAGLPVPAERAHVVFTAHSLPERVLVDDPYPGQLAEAAAAVAEAVGLDEGRWSIGWQSAGRTPDPWRGPDILDVLGSLADSGGVDGVLVCPHGFVADHLEVLYDLDREAAGRAAALGLAFARTRSLNADEAVLGELAERVRTTAEALAR